MLPCCIAMTIIFGGFFIASTLIKNTFKRITGQAVENGNKHWDRPHIKINH